MPVEKVIRPLKTVTKLGLVPSSSPEAPGIDAFGRNPSSADKRWSVLMCWRKLLRLSTLTASPEDEDVVYESLDKPERICALTK